MPYPEKQIKNQDNVIIKSAYDVAQMRIAGRLASEVLDFITPYVKEGVTTEYLDKLCHDYIVNEQQSIPAPLNYQPGPSYTPYPKSICTSVNNEICHGIPSSRVLKDGDIVNIDITVKKNGYHGDTSRMFYIGNVKPYVKRLCEVTYECMWLGIEVVKPGAFLGDIGFAIQKHAERHGYSVVQDFCGHGVGLVFHEEPQVLHYGRPKTGIKLETGMIFTIEPMINQGSHKVRFLNDGWTAVTKDRSLSAQWEHTILVTDTGYDVLTVSDGSPPRLLHPC